MDLQFSENETLLKNWDYAIAAEKGFFKPKTCCSLVITDKRIVHIQKDKKHTQRKEVPIKSVTAVESSVSKTRPWTLAGLVIGLGVVLIILGVLLYNFKLPLGGWLSAVIIGIVAIIIAVLLLIFNLKVRLSVKIKTDIKINHTDKISASARMFAVKYRSNKSLRIKVDPAVADDIVNTIGIVLIAEKENYERTAV